MVLTVKVRVFKSLFQRNFTKEKDLGKGVQHFERLERMM